MKRLLIFSYYLLFVSVTNGQGLPDSLYLKHNVLLKVKDYKPFTGILNLYFGGIVKKKMRSSTFYRDGLKDSFDVEYYTNGSTYRIDYFKGHRLDSFGWFKNGKLDNWAWYYDKKGRIYLA